MDAAFVNKWTTGERSWLTRDTADDDEIQDASKGGRGERFTLLRAFADYVDDEGRRRASFIQGALLWARGVSVDSDAFLPWFERVVAEASAMFRGGTFEVHLDNSRVHMYSSDFNPRDTRHRRADILQASLAACEAMEGSDDDDMAGQLEDYLQDATKKGRVRFLTTASGARVPGIFKKALDCGCVVERAPPYAPEAQPIEPAWNAMKTSHNTRYDNARSVPDFLRSFFNGFPEGQLPSSVRHSDAAAQRLARPEEAILAYDDMGAQDCAEEPLGLAGPDDVDFTDVGEMWG